MRYMPLSSFHLAQPHGPSRSGLDQHPSSNGAGRHTFRLAAHRFEREEMRFSQLPGKSSPPGVLTNGRPASEPPLKNPLPAFEQ